MADSSSSSGKECAKPRKKTKRPRLPRKRRTPCEFCRARQRACNGNEPCNRCVLANIECVYVKDRLPTSSDDDEEDGDIFIDAIEKDLHELELTLLTFEELKQQLENDLSRPKQHHYHHTEIHVDTQQISNWKLTLLKNGHIRIYANISNFDDLLKFAQSGFRQTSGLIDYTPPSHPLNPRSDLYHQYALLNRSPLTKFSKLFQNRIMKEAVDHEDHLAGLMNSYGLKGEESNLSVLAPSDTLQGLLAVATRRDVLSHLLAIFWQCVIPHIPVLHEETIKSRFYNRQDPTSSPLICMILATGAAWNCKHVFPDLNFPNLSRNRDLRKRIGAFLYEKAKSALEFDKDDFETFATHCLIGQYGIFSLQAPLAASSCVTACRTGAIMCEKISEMDPIEGEMFKRLYQVSWQCHMNFASYAPEEKIQKGLDVRRKIGKFLPFPDEDLVVSLFFDAFFYYVDIASVVETHAKAESDLYKKFVAQMEYDLVTDYNAAPSRLKTPLHLALDPPHQFSGRHSLIYSYGYHAIWLRLHQPFLPLPGEPSNRSLTICTHAAAVITKAYELVVKIHNPCHVNFDILLRAASIHERNSNVEGLVATIWIIKNSSWMTNSNILPVVKRLEDIVQKLSEEDIYYIKLDL